MMEEIPLELQNPGESKADTISEVKDEDISEEFKCEKWLVPIAGYLFGLLVTVFVCMKNDYISTSEAVLVFTLATFVAFSMIFTIVSVLLLRAAIEKNSPQVKRYFRLTVVHLCLQNIMAVVVPIVILIEGKTPTITSLNWMVVIMIVGLGWTHLILRFRAIGNLFSSYTEY